MVERVYDEPQDLLRFVSDEHHQLLIAIANEQDELKAVNHLQGLYSAALSHVRLSKRADLIVYQLIGFTHYHFLFATACQLRCHMAEAFNSLRCAIDGALVAACIIKDRPSQEAYFSRHHTLVVGSGGVPCVVNQVRRKIVSQATAIRPTIVNGRKGEDCLARRRMSLRMRIMVRPQALSWR